MSIQNKRTIKSVTIIPCSSVIMFFQSHIIKNMFLDSLCLKLCSSALYNITERLIL